MKKALFLILTLMCVCVASAQETVTLKFTSTTPDDSYFPFDVVNVTNITRNWTESLTYPDTTMVLTSYDGLQESIYQEGFISEVYPNPLSGNAYVYFEMGKSGLLNANIFSINGSVLSEYTGFIDKGVHQITINISKPQMAFLVLRANGNQYTKKILNIDTGSNDNISINKVSDITHSPKTRDGGEFFIGDIMSYMAVSFVGNNMIESNRITQAQYSDDTIILTFPITDPSVSTSEITNISINTATAGGVVLADGGGIVSARGVCWNTNQNPTISNYHTLDGSGEGSFTSSLTGLSSNTTYYVRAYATNEVTTSYGDEVRFTTLPPMTDIRILSIGNSYSADALGYVPFIWQNMGVDVNIRIGILIMGGATLANHLENFENQAPNYNYILYDGGNSWQNYGNQTIQYALDNYEWDIIMLQEYSGCAPFWYYYQPTLNDLISHITNYLDSPVKFGWYMVQSRAAMNSWGQNYPDTTILSRYDSISVNAQRVLNETICEFVVPVGTAIQNARTIPAIKALGDYANVAENTSGMGYLSAEDGIHLQEGLPCQIAAYTFVLSFLERCGCLDAYSIIGESTRVTQEWLIGKNIPGINGEPVGSNDTNCIIGQQCVIEAYNNPWQITDMNKIHIIQLLPK